MQEWLPTIIIVVLLLGIVFYIVRIYNSLVQLRNRFKNAFSQIDVQLKRRYDLIPNLVETAKGYLKHERETLESVIQARNQAQSANEQAANDPSDPESMKKLVGAESALTGAMGKFFALSESYPDLKANQNMMQLSEEMTTTENKISFARQAFNDAVMAYNNGREQFPANVFAGMFNFKPAEYFEVEVEKEREAPDVNFTNSKVCGRIAHMLFLCFSTSDG